LLFHSCLFLCREREEGGEVFESNLLISSNTGEEKRTPGSVDFCRVQRKEKGSISQPGGYLPARTKDRLVYSTRSYEGGDFSFAHNSHSIEE